MKEIKEKSNYCLNCPVKPCSNKGCPLGNDIPGFIKAVREEDYEKAYEILKADHFGIGKNSALKGR